VIFAFGGNALIATSFYVVQRTCRARLAFGGASPWFVFWGYQLFIVLAATGYLLGITQGKEYAEPEWYVDLWLTVVWVAYLARLRRHDREAQGAAHLCGQLVLPRLHHHHRDAALVNNLSLPVSFLGAKSYAAFPACRMR
jgi:cytochrome c oxidase cbb3-type subunit 1